MIPAKKGTVWLQKQVDEKFLPQAFFDGIKNSSLGLLKSLVCPKLTYKTTQIGCICNNRDVNTSSISDTLSYHQVHYSDEKSLQTLVEESLVESHQNPCHQCHSMREMQTAILMEGPTKILVVSLNRQARLIAKWYYNPYSLTLGPFGLKRLVRQEAARLKLTAP